MRSKLLALALLTACSQASPPPNPPPAPPPAPAPLPTAEIRNTPPPPSAAPPTAPTPKAVERSAYGKIDGKDIWLFTLSNQHGLTVKIMNFGATVTSVLVPDKSGKLADIVLGYEKAESYATGTSFLGATIGRVANRIRDAKFKLDGKEYTLAANDKPHALHGGSVGWSKRMWDAEPLETAAGPAVKLTYVSKDGEEGYPGNVTATTTYTLTQNDELKIEMEAVTDRPTLVSMAHHGYWNLGGVGSGPITDHELTLFADAYTPGDPLVPTGAIKPVKGTPFDFTTAKPIGKDLAKTDKKLRGYDTNFVVRGDANALRPVAKLRDPKSGRVLTLEANQPGVMVYTGNYLDGSIHEKGTSYPQYGAICLESQKFPNAINVPAWHDQAILKPGETYRHVMIHRFSVE